MRRLFWVVFAGLGGQCQGHVKAGFVSLYQCERACFFRVTTKGNRGSFFRGRTREDRMGRRLSSKRKAEISFSCFLAFFCMLYPPCFVYFCLVFPGWCICLGGKGASLSFKGGTCLFLAFGMIHLGGMSVSTALFCESFTRLGLVLVMRMLDTLGIFWCCGVDVK